ncbi:MAG TPA: hypothetical protein VIT62_03260 [Lysobacter sp.]
MTAPVQLHAEEGGSGHYQPGSMASFMDSVAPKPTLLLHWNQLLADLKWIHEFNAEQRPEGDTVFFKLMYKFNL